MTINSNIAQPYSLGIYVYDVTVKWLVIIAKLIKELPERKIGENKSKIGSSLMLIAMYRSSYIVCRYS